MMLKLKHVFIVQRLLLVRVAGLQRQQPPLSFDFALNESRARLRLHRVYPRQPRFLFVHATQPLIVENE